MTRRLAWVLSVAAILLGLGHLSIGALSFQQLSFGALWFTGSGIAIVMGGMLNLFALLASYGRGGLAVLGLANLVLAGFFALALTLLPGPQVIAGLAIFVGLAALGRVSQPPRTA
jgi:hypothetical protein